ncbi:DUF2207 domain-containing protein [Sporosarcina sp. ITBMC105]
MRSLRFILCMLLLSITFPVHHAQAKSFSIDDVQIQAYIMDNGDLYVEELYTYNFSGTYNGTTRIIGDDNHKGVKYFEGYLAPMDTDLSQYDNSTFTRLEVEREGRTFKIHTPSENEKKKVFYRYLIRGAAQKYSDTGQLYWRFFDELNETDLHNVRLRLILSGDKDATLAGEAYLHSTAGELKKSMDYGFLYAADLLEAYETLEIRFLFPETFLQNAPYDEDKAMLAEFEEEEAAYVKWLEKKESAMPTVELINIILFFSTILLFIVTILYPRRLIRLYTSTPRLRQLEDFDPFLLGLIERKGKIEPNAISAALLRLRQKGIVNMEKVPANAVYRSDENAPDYTFRFTLVKQLSTLSEFEQDLIDWLFERNAAGDICFSLDQFPYMSKQQREQHWRLESEYAQQSKRLTKRFKKWKEIVRKDPEVKQYCVLNPIRKWLVRIGIPLWIVVAILNIWMTTADIQDVVVMTILLWFAYVLLLFNLSWRAALPIFFAFCFIWTWERSMEGFYSLFTMSSVLFFVAGLLLPLMDIKKKAAPYYKAAKAFKKAIRSGSFDRLNGLSEEKWQAHAIALRLFVPLRLKYEKTIPENLASLPPLTIRFTEMLTSFHYTHRVYYSHMSSSSSGGGSGSSSGSGGGGGAGAF